MHTLKFVYCVGLSVVCITLMVLSSLRLMLFHVATYCVMACVFDVY